MTREEMLALEPGEKLDDLVDDIIFNLPFGAPPYSTDIAEAWKVVSELTKIYNHFTLGFNGKWLCGIANYGDNFETLDNIYADGKTAPEAICKAALLAALEVQA